MAHSRFISFPYFNSCLSKVFVLFLRRLLQLPFLPFIFSHDSRILDFYFESILTLGLSLVLTHYFCNLKRITNFALLSKARFGFYLLLELISVDGSEAKLRAGLFISFLLP